MDLITRNMKAMYEKSQWGWNDANKKKEMLDDNAWYSESRLMWSLWARSKVITLTDDSKKTAQNVKLHIATIKLPFFSLLEVI